MGLYWLKQKDYHVAKMYFVENETEVWFVHTLILYQFDKSVQVYF